MMFKFFFRAIALLVAVIVAVPAYALFVTWNSANNSSLRTTAEVIVIPGAAQLDGTPGPVLQARLEQAVRLFRAGVAPLVITVGSGAPGDRTTEADAGRKWLILCAGTRWSKLTCRFYESILNSRSRGLPFVHHFRAQRHTSQRSPRLRPCDIAIAIRSGSSLNQQNVPVAQNLCVIAHA